MSSPAQIRRAFANEHERGHPSMAHMLVTGDPVPPVDPVVTELILEALDSTAAALVRRWPLLTGRAELALVETLARHVLGADTFFEWSSDRDPVPTS